MNRSYTVAAVFSLLALAGVGFAGRPALAQNTFNSGSTGADGAFEPDASREVAVPESGVFHFTRVHIPSGVIITFKRNSRNTPVTILTKEEVIINGQINISGGHGTAEVVAGSRTPGGKGGPGGFDGGAGGAYAEPFLNGVSGDGPGGGTGATGTVDNSRLGSGGGGGHALPGGDAAYAGTDNTANGRGGMAYGSRTLQPLIGGSGGGGGSANQLGRGGSGGGGGGAIVIASSDSISFSNGSIVAQGGTGAWSYGGGGGGGGGAIRLVSNVIRGSSELYVDGGQGNNGGGSGSFGFIRLEAFRYEGFNPRISPNDPRVISLAPPSSVSLPSPPSLRIASVAGVAAPAQPKGSFTAPADVLLSENQANPVSVALEGKNIPVGTVVTVQVAPQTGRKTTAQSSPLAGTLAASTATASVALPEEMAVLHASAVIPVTGTNSLQSTPLLYDGERIIRLEAGTTFGGKSVLYYVTDTGKRIPVSDSAVLQHDTVPRATDSRR